MADIIDNLDYGTITGQFTNRSTDNTDAGKRPQAAAWQHLKAVFVPDVPDPQLFRDLTPTDPQTFTMFGFVGSTDLDGNLASILDLTSPDMQLPASISDKIDPSGFTWRVRIFADQETTLGGLPIPAGVSFPEVEYNFTLAANQSKDLTTMDPVPPDPGSEIIDWQKAVDDAREAEAAAKLAALEAAAFGGTNNQQVAVMVSNPGPTKDAVVGTVAAAVVPSVNEYLAGNPAVIDAVAELAQSDAGLLRVDLLDPDEPRNRWELSFPGGETFLTYEEIPDHSPYLTWVKYNTGEFQSYVKKNGDVYPPVAITPTTPSLVAQVAGDSIAENWGAYAGALAAALGRSVTFEGIGGQQSPAVAARQGGVPAYVTVNGNALTASGAVSVTAITEPDGTAVSPLLLTANGSRTRTVVVGGARCTLAATTTSGVASYTLTQINGSAVITCPPGTPMVPLDLPAGALTILLGPRNDLGPNAGDGFRKPIADIVKRYTAMVTRAKRNGGSVILLPVLPRSDADANGKANLVTLNNALRDLAPQDYADWLAWLQSDAAFTAAGVVKTTDDAADIAAAQTPRSFRGDIVHPNAAGYAAANRFIELVRKSRGI